MGYRDRALGEQCMLPPRPARPPGLGGVHHLAPVDGLRAATARALAREARTAHEQGDKARFEGAVAALVELAIGPPRRG